MRSKIRFIQREYSADLDTKSDYLLIVEIVEGVPTASYNVRLPVSIALFPNSIQFNN